MVRCSRTVICSWNCREEDGGADIRAAAHWRPHITVGGYFLKGLLPMGSQYWSRFIMKDGGQWKKKKQTTLYCGGRWWWRSSWRGELLQIDHNALFPPLFQLGRGRGLGNEGVMFSLGKRGTEGSWCSPCCSPSSSNWKVIQLIFPELSLFACDSNRRAISLSFSQPVSLSILFSNPVHLRKRNERAAGQPSGIQPGSTHYIKVLTKVVISCFRNQCVRNDRSVYLCWWVVLMIYAYLRSKIISTLGWLLSGFQALGNTGLSFQSLNSRIYCCTLICIATFPFGLRRWKEEVSLSRGNM